MAIRQLKIKGNKISETVLADIIINDVTVFSGEIGTGAEPVAYSDQPGNSGDLVVVQYNGTGDDETISIEVKINEGTALVGPIFSDLIDVNNNNELSWVNKGTDDVNLGDGRYNIKIDGIAPTWPTDPKIVSPGGSPENPAWTGYCFMVPSESVLTCTYDVTAQYTILDDGVPV